MSKNVATETAADGDAQPTLAEQRSAVTRDAIVKATQTLLIEKHPAALSVPMVAKEAGVSVRTIYRYFPNKEALLDAMATHFPKKAYDDGRWVQDSFDENEAGLIRLWTSFSQNIDAVRAEHLSPAGADFRQRRLSETRTQLAKHVLANFPDAPAADRAQLTDMIVALCSSSMFLELHDRLDHDAEDAAHLVIWAAKALFADFAKQQKSQPD